MRRKCVGELLKVEEVFWGEVVEDGMMIFMFEDVNKLFKGGL